MKLRDASKSWRLLNGRQDTQRPDLVLETIREEPRLSVEVELLRVQLSDLQKYQRTPEGYTLFPALALPVKREKNFICPRQHLEKAEKFFAECKNFLFVGFSGVDPHVLRLFNRASAIERLTIVNGTRDAGEKLFNSLCSANKEFGSTHLWRSKPLILDGGFRTFMESANLDAIMST